MPLGKYYSFVYTQYKVGRYCVIFALEREKGEKKNQKQKNIDTSKTKTVNVLIWVVDLNTMIFQMVRNAKMYITIEWDVERVLQHSIVPCTI